MTRRHLILREAAVKTSLNNTPITARPAAPRCQIASAERHATSPRTNEEIVAGLRDICGEYARRGILVVCLNDPRLTQSQAERARRLMSELYPEQIGKRR